MRKFSFILIALSMLIFIYTGCSSNLAEGFRTIAGQGGKYEKRDIIEEITPHAIEMSAEEPPPEWQAILRADQADIFMLIKENSLLVGELQLSAKLSVPDFGNVSLYDTRSHQKVWECPRKKLKGTYTVLLSDPIILLLGSSQEKAYYMAIDPETGQLLWDREVRTPQAYATDKANNRLLVLAQQSEKWTLAALDFSSGLPVWENPLGQSSEVNEVDPWVFTSGNSAILYTGRISSISTQSGEQRWCKQPPVDARPSVLSTENGIALWSGCDLCLIDYSTGNVIWGPKKLAGDIRFISSGLSKDKPCLFAVHLKEYYSDYITMIDAVDGDIEWSYGADPVLSQLFLEDGSLYFTSANEIIALDSKTGKRRFNTKIPEDLFWKLDMPPDLVTSFGNKIIICREPTGIAAYDRNSGKELFHHSLGWPMLDYRYQSRISLLRSRIGQDMSEETLDEGLDRLSKAKFIAMGERIDKNAKDLGVIDAVAFSRQQQVLHDRYVQQIDRAFAGNPRAQATLLSVENSMASMQASIQLCAALTAFGTGLVESLMGAKAEEGLVRRTHLEVVNSLSQHLNSIQGKYYVRPFSKWGRGVTVVDLESGRRADFRFGTIHFGLNKYGLKLSSFAIDPSSNSLLTVGIGMDVARWERYVKWGFGMPYPFVLCYDLDKMRFDRRLLNDPALVYAAMHGKLDEVKRLLDDGVDANSTDGSGETALIKACGNGHVEIVELLLEHGADVHIATRGGFKPINLANTGEIVRMLRKAGAEVDIESLADAVAYGDAECVQKMIDEGIDVNANGNCQTLSTASYYGYEDILDILLRANIQVDGEVGRKALYYAAEKGYTSIVRKLIAAGAEVNPKNSDDEAAIAAAAQNHHMDIVEMLIHAGADPNGKNDRGTTAFYDVAALGDIRVAKLLIESGADVNIGNFWGTALCQAATKGHTEMVKLLLDANTEPGSALADAANLDIIKMLLKAGSDVNVRNWKTWTSLMTSAARGDEASVKFLLQAGADVNAKNGGKRTAASLAMEGRHYEIVELLVEAKKGK